ncbi:hypothetical protein [Sulfurimonas sp.]|uniref:hypothetical protein n=1 Tax=Sulfurimonas sp. TaxID=2022749 RepID=UPI003D11DAC7
MSIRRQILKIANQHNVSVEQKTIYLLNKFINELDLEPAKAHNFIDMVQKIKNSYTNKSYKSEMFFIKNIAHTVNTQTNENLFDFKTLNLAKNFKSKITEQSLYNYKKAVNVYSTDSEIIAASNNLEMHHHKGNTRFIEEMDSKYSFKKLAKVKYIDNKNKEKTPVMLTLTVDNTYRKYVKQDKSVDIVLGEFTNLLEINKNANLEEFIENSYEELNTTFRAFYHYMKTLNRRSKEKEKLDFIMIFEPHKSLTLHLHVLFYCNEVHLQNLYRAWDNYLKDLSPDQVKGQDLKVIDREKATGATYLSKYLIKEYNTDTKESSFFMQFKRYFSKFKLFRTSNFYHTTQAKIDKMYSHLCANYPDILEKIRFSEVPIYEVLERMEIEGLFIFEKENVESLTFDRKAIQAFYKAYAHTHKDSQIKQQIKDNIEHFAKPTTHTRIKEAKFIFDREILNGVFESYQVEKVELKPEENAMEVFYTSNMYRTKIYELNQAIAIANDIALSTLKYNDEISEVV